MNEVNRKKRHQFAKEHANKDKNWWSHAIFADGSKFNVFGSKGQQYVWYKP